MIPIPPFDGGTLLPYILPSHFYDVIGWLEDHSLFILLFLFLVPGVRDVFFMGLFVASESVRAGLSFLVI